MEKLFFKSLEDKNVEISVEDEGLNCEVSEGSKDSTGPFVWRICGSGQLELKSQL